MSVGDSTADRVATGHSSPDGGSKSGSETGDGADAEAGTRAEIENAQWLLGIDAGLTKTKAVVFTPAGEEVAVADRSTPEDRPDSDRREVDLESLWDGVTAVVSEVLEHESIDPEAVAAVGVAGHGHGLYTLDSRGEPVRPGIKSTDSRAIDLVAEWETDGTAEAIRERLGYAPFAADPLSLLGWLERHEPDAYSRIDRLLFCKDYLTYRLTDRVSTDETEASVFFDPRTDEYDTGVFDVLGLESCAEALPPIDSSWESCGRVTADAAAKTGLTAGTPVATGLHDVGATALGAGVHEPGQGVLVVGTWGQSVVVLDDPLSGAAMGTEDDAGDDHATDRTKTAPPGLTRRFLEDGYFRYKGNRSATACLEWLLREVGHEWRERAAEEGVSPYEICDRVVADVPAGARGVLFHPYLDGSTDEPTDRGGFYGLRIDSTAADMLRAVYEGVAISQALRLSELTPADGLTDVRLAGGGARSAVWSDLFADALESELVVPAGEETGACGAAICGALAAGVHPDHATAVDRMVSVARRHEPDPETEALYRERKRAFEEALAAIRPTWKLLANATDRVDIDE